MEFSHISMTGKGKTGTAMVSGTKHAAGFDNQGGSILSLGLVLSHSYPRMIIMLGGECAIDAHGIERQ